MKESYIETLISFVLSGFSFALVYARTVLLTIGVHFITHNTSSALQGRLQTALSVIDTGLFLLPASAFALSLLLFTKKTYLPATAACAFSLASFFYYLTQIL